MKPKFSDREPLTLRALVVLVVGAVVDLVVLFGVQLPAGLETAIVGVVMAAALVYAVATGRRRVTPVADPRVTPR